MENTIRRELILIEEAKGFLTFEDVIEVCNLTDTDIFVLKYDTKGKNDDEDFIYNKINNTLNLRTKSFNEDPYNDL